MNDSRVTSAPGRPSALERVAAVVVLVEAIASGVWAVLTAMVAYSGAVERPQTLWFMIVFAAILAVALTGAAWGMWRGSRWARGPVGAWNVLQVGIGLMSATSNLAVGLALVLVAAVALVGVVAAVRRSAHEAAATEN